MRSAFLFLIVAGCLTGFARAEEPARAFLDGLRARGYFDVAMDYLDQLETSPLAPPELKSALLYEKSLLLIDSSRRQRDPAVRVEQLDQAQQWLQSFIDSESSSPKLNAARSQLGSLIVERARMKHEDSKKEGDAPQLVKEARELYEQAFEVFSELQENVQQQLDEIPKVLNTRDREEARLIERRTQLRADFLQTELLAAAIREELADIVPAGAAEQAKLLQEAAQMYDGIYKNYRTRLAGRYARMYQGRCYRRLGKTKEALGYFGELLDQPNEPETLMMLKAKTLAMAMDAWLSPNQQKYVEAIKRATRWFDETPAEKEREAAWIEIRFHLARALKMQADDAKSTEPVNRLLIEKSLEAAKRELSFVASETGEFQEPAQQLLTKLGGPNVMEEEPEPDSLMTAQARAKESLDTIAPLSAGVKNLEAHLASEKNANKREALQQELLAAQEKLREAEDGAIHYYRLALELADNQTPQSSIHLVQYFLCYAYFVRQNYFDAALVGDFVARRYPDSPGAKQCAKIAMASYLKLSEQAAEDGIDFEIERLQSVGEFMSDTWADDAQSLQSITTLIPFLINAGKPSRAADFVRRLPPESASRGQYELITGQSMWGAFRTLQQQDASKDEDGVVDKTKAAEKQKELERLKSEAKSLLQAGYDRLPDEPVVDTANATALLSLAQIYVENQEFQMAIEVLEHDELGPLTLVEQNSVAASNPLFIEESYRTALRAYVASIGSSGPALMDKAKGIMAAMRQLLGDDPQGKMRMLGVYVNLAQDVQQQMKTADPESRQKLSSVFEAFLEELSAGSEDLAVLNWVADTFAKLASGFNDGEQMSEDARKYYDRADTAFEKLLGQPGLAADMAVQAKSQLADVKFQKKEYEAALQLYKDVLEKNPNMINIQVAAARLLQAWGAQEPKRYEDAIKGIQSAAQKPVIWGWGKTGLAAVAHPQFRETFYESRHSLATCQRALASTKSGGERENLLREAARNLSTTAKLYPAMGDWKEKFHVLLKDVQTAQGQPAVGLD